MSGSGTSGVSSPSDATAIEAPDASVDGSPMPCPAASPQTAPKPGCGKSAEEYQKQAQDQIAKAGPDMLARNKAITQAYADMYKSDPSTYKWAGMAAFASCEVGKGMKEAQDAESGWKSYAGKFTGVDAKKLEKALQTGNNAVYNDIYWEHLAYQSCGIAELEKAYNEGKINDKVITAWRKIDAGKTAGDPAAIWDGNGKLLEYEQRTVLQDAVYDQDRAIWKNISTAPVKWYQKIESPIPGDKQSFQKYVDGGDIGNFDDRWKWISKSMLPAWQKLDQNPSDALNKLAPCTK